MDGASVVVVTTTVRSQDDAPTFRTNDDARPQTFTDPPPPYDAQTFSSAQLDELAIDASSVGPNCEGSADRKLTRIYNSLFEEANSSAPPGHTVQGINVMLPDGHSNGWYDNCFTRSCVCDYTGRHVIPEYITSGSLYRGRVLGWKIFREIALPLMNDVFRIVWTILQLIGAMLLLIFSVFIYVDGTVTICNIIHLSLSSLALLLASVDLCAVIVKKVMLCRTTNGRYTQFHNIIAPGEGAGSDHNGINDAPSVENATNSINMRSGTSAGCTGGKQWGKFSNVDIARLIIPELLLFPIVVCDVYLYVINDKFIGLILSISILILEVYVVRLALLTVMTYRVHTKLSFPKHLNLTREAIIGAGYDPTIRRNGLIYLSFLIFNVVTHIINQIAMIVAIGVKISNFVVTTPTYAPCQYYWDCNHYDYSDDPNKQPFQFWFMIVAGYILPIVGVWLFFSVTHFWLQEFAIGVTVDFLSILKLPGANRLFFPDCTLHEAQEKANKILHYSKYETLRQDYHALRNENILVKAWYPFKSFSHTLMCLTYTTVQAIFVYAAAISIHGEQLNMAVFLFVIITELLSNIYILLVSLFWIVVAVLFLVLVALALAVSIKCLVCIIICCGSMFDTSRGPPQPPVMTPQIRAGLQQV